MQDLNCRVQHAGTTFIGTRRHTSMRALTHARLYAQVCGKVCVSSEHLGLHYQAEHADEARQQAAAQQQAAVADRPQQQVFAYVTILSLSQCV